MSTSPAALLKELPIFSTITADQIEPNLKTILARNRHTLSSLLTQESFTWDSLLKPIEEFNDNLSKMWSPISHLHSVMETEALRAAYQICIPLLTEYGTEQLQNEHLFVAIESIAKSPEYQFLNPAQRKIIENDLRDFKLLGIHLIPEKKQRMAELQTQLSLLTNKFSDNVLDATGGWILTLTKPEQLRGLPEAMVKAAKQTAEERNIEGWVITLEYPSYSTAIKFLQDRELRQTLYEAYVTRASDQGPNKGRWDNTSVMEEILKIRQEIAHLAGFANYAEYSLATKMAKSPAEVIDFLTDLLVKSRPFAEKEMEELKKFALKTDKLTDLEPWDVPYYSEKLRQTKFDFSQEELRPYFPLTKVLSGLFTIVQQLYGLRIEEEKNIDIWHPSVQFFSIFDEKNELRGGLYIDLYARPHKRDGAWMDDCRVRRRLANGELQYPVAYLTCNFMRPLEGQEALLTHDDVLTLFHEFGHCLHHLLTQVEYGPVSGINGVPWDTVEFPSQFMEHWCWEKEGLALISGHYQTGEPLPDAFFRNLLAAKHFQAGLQMLRQLEFSLFDFRLHLEFDAHRQNQILGLLAELRKQTSLLITPPYYRFPHSFSHIFAGGYGAGYYSYKWAEVLSADAFEQFEENGILDPATGRSFLKNILEVGGVPHPVDAFKAFRGREPHVDALLRQSGLTAEA